MWYVDPLLKMSLSVNLFVTALQIWLYDDCLLNIFEK